MFKETRMGILERINFNTYALQTKHERIMFTVTRGDKIDIRIISHFDLKSQRYFGNEKYKLKYSLIKELMENILEENKQVA